MELHRVVNWTLLVGMKATRLNQELDKSSSVETEESLGTFSSVSEEHKCGSNLARSTMRVFHVYLTPSTWKVRSVLKYNRPEALVE